MIFYPGLQVVYGGLLVLLTHIPARRSAFIPKEVVPHEQYIGSANWDGRMAGSSPPSAAEQLKYVSCKVQLDQEKDSSGGTSFFHSDMQRAQRATTKETPLIQSWKKVAHLPPPPVIEEIEPAVSAVSPAMQLQHPGHGHPQLTHLGGGGPHSPPVSQSILPPARSPQTLPPSQRTGPMMEGLFGEPENLPVNAAPNRADSTAFPAQARSDNPIIQEVEDESSESPKPLAQSPETIQYSVEEPNEEPEHPQHTVSKGSTIEQTNLNPKAQDPVGPPTRGRQTPVPPPPKNEGAVVPPLPDMSMPLKQLEIMVQEQIKFNPQEWDQFKADLWKHFHSVPSETNTEAKLSEVLTYTSRWLRENGRYVTFSLPSTSDL